jgi:predicted ATPase/class 3 adenylate cyclase
MLEAKAIVMPVTRTFLLTDIEGSTRSEQREPVAWGKNHKVHDRIVEDLVRANNGEVYKNTGDGYQAAFVNAPDALKAAVEIQRELEGTTWEGDSPVRIRIGLHTGEAEQRGGDYLGDDLHRAARLMDAGHGGQVLLSLVTSELVRDALRREPALAGVDLRDLGVYALKDLQRPERIFQVAAEGLGSSFPLLRCEKAFFSNLPTESGTFIGRQAELSSLRAQLSRTRLLTICGGGGVGKTRLATQLAREVAPDFRDGVALIELGPVSDPDLVVQTVASVFGVRESAGLSLKDSLVSYLQKKAVLLVFDNCEHLLDASTDLIWALLSRSTELKVIATSRERLDVDGEALCSLQMLLFPAAPEKATLEDLGRYGALDLFVQEARNADPEFNVTADNIKLVAQICKQLDGNALAIRLAASLTPTLSLREMLERLRERFDVLVGWRRHSVARHKTLKAALDWSYERLEPEEAELFHRLGVFAGAWTLEAVERVCVDGVVGQGALVTLMNGLVRKSLVARVRATEGAGAESRFGMLETVREYARLQLRGTGELEKLQLAHAEYFTSLAGREAGRVWGAEPEVGITRLEQVYDDIVSALEWARKSDAGKASGLELHLAAELGPFWERRGFLTEGRERLAQALRAKRIPEHDRWRVDALEAAARLAYLQSEYSEAIELYEKSLKLRRELASRKGDLRLQHGIVGVLNKIGRAATRNGDFRAAEKRLKEAMALAEKTGHTRGIVGALDNLAEVAWRQGDFEGALARYKECLTHAAKQKGRQKDLSTLSSLIGQGRVLMMQGKYDEAAKAFSACLNILKGHDNKTGLAYSYADLSEVAYRKGDYEAARAHAEESLRLRCEAKNEWGIANSQQLLAQVEQKEGLDEQALLHAKESLLAFEQLVAKKGIADCLLLIAAISLDNGDRERAAKLFGAAEMLLDSRGAQLSAPQRDHYERAILNPAREKLDKDDWEKGRELGLDAAIALAQEYTIEEPAAP